ncbi:MAG: hypothetical protein ACQCN6_00655 [Candidatus Bathyarchaeia archaeon]|jgi:predicted ATP-grasp superfamily ATP-dependent carboligase
MNSNNEYAVIVSNHGHDLNALGAVRSLAAAGVKTVWLTPKSSSWYYSKYCVPYFCPDFLDEKKFINFLLKLGENLPKPVLIPTSDKCLIPLSKNKKVLENYYYPLVCDWKTTKSFIDKNITFQIAEASGIPSPKTYLPNNEAEVLELSNKLDYPCLVKPTASHVFSSKFNVKLVRASNSFELIKIFRFFVSNGFQPMIQEEIPGNDSNLITLNTVLNENSEPLAFFMHRRIVQVPPRFGVVALGESCWTSRIIQPGLKILKNIKFSGLAQLEFKEDKRSNDFKLIEINGRSYRSISFPTACGLNLIHIAYQNARGEKLSPLTHYSCMYKCGVKWLDFPSFLQSILKIHYTEGIPMGKLVQPILSKNVVFSTFSMDDWAPSINELFFLIRKLLRYSKSKNDLRSMATLKPISTTNKNNAISNRSKSVQLNSRD